MNGGHADMTCVPAAVLATFSQRSQQVAAKLGELVERWSTEHDGEDPEPRTIASLERAAVLASRPAKTHGVDAAALHDTWTRQGTAAGLDIHSLVAERLPSGAGPPLSTDNDLITEALRRVAEESSTWLRADLARHVATLLPPEGSVTARELVARVDQLAEQAEDRCVDLSPHDPHGDRCRRDGRPLIEHVTDHRFTTTAILQQEQGLQRWAQASVRDHAPTAGDASEAAVRAMAGHSRLVVVVGPAGTGKTTATAEAVTALQANRRPVIGLAPSGKAADVLATEAGCPTDTLAGFLTRHAGTRSSPPPAGTTIVLDEAGMVTTDDLTRLVNLAHRHRWRLVAVGDPHQLPAVGRGGVFGHWCRTLPHYELDTPRRFTQSWEAQASLALRAGDPQAADTYNQHRRLHVVHPALLSRWITEIHHQQTERGRTVAVTTATADTARAINQAIQGSPGIAAGVAAALADGTHARAGDQIATRRNHPDLRTNRGERVRNRHTWTVNHVGDDGSLAVTHPARGTIVLPTGYVTHHVELGWAVTGYGNQGDTVDIGIAALEPGTSRNHAYVALTRGRLGNIGYLPDPTGTVEPAQQLANLIARPADKDSALATYENLRQADPNRVPQIAAAPRRPSVGAGLHGLRSVRPRPAQPRPAPKL